jgi:hypothetical protein
MNLSTNRFSTIAGTFPVNEEERITIMSMIMTMTPILAMHGHFVGCGLMGICAFALKIACWLGKSDTK